MELKSYTLSVQEEGMDFTILFECKAEDAEHAIEQAVNAYPGSNAWLYEPQHQEP